MRDPMHDAYTLGQPSELESLLIDGNLGRVLFINSSVPSVHGWECREAEPLPRIPLVPGTWCFREGRHLRAVVVGDGKGASFTGFQTDIEVGHPAWPALATFEISWAGAASRDVAPPAFTPGAAVSLRGGNDGRVGNIIGSPRRVAGGWEYDVRFGAVGHRARETDLIPARTTAISATEWLPGNSLSVDDVVTLITLAKVEQPLTDVLYSYGATRTVFRSYQFKPLLKLMRSATQRLLIADEVGLGKTIEAGLIWSELDRRAGVRRALVVCPASLCRKWQSEMKRRFDRDVEILDRRRLAELANQFSEGREPSIAGVISLESLRTAPELDQLAELSPRFDLIIVDEAHALRNTGTRSFTLGELLSDWADVLLFLSATPLNLGRQDLFNLLNLLNPEDYPDAEVFDAQIAPNQVVNQAIAVARRAESNANEVVDQLVRLSQTTFGAGLLARPEIRRVLSLLTDGPLTPASRSEVVRLLLELSTLSATVTRTRKVDTPDAKATRVARSVAVSWTEEEARLYQAILRWARDRALRNNGVVGFATVMPLRQAASCLHASKRRFADEWSTMDPGNDDFDDVDDLDVDGVEQWAHDDVDRDLRDALRALGDVDTKFDSFVQVLRDLRAEGIPQVMVFSFFRGTLKYLAERLHNDWRVRVMDGSITSMEARAKIMQDFRDGQFDILLVSEVGSEGLDFEFCGALVNYDLPWNPMKVEQRIGRLDRFGQRFERIQIFNFHVPGTIETDILERLYQRIRVFEESIGELEPIIRDDMSQITKLVLDPARSPEEREREVHRLELAFETRRAELQELRDAGSSMLTGLDQMLVDGLESDTLDRGKYVGDSEILAVLSRFVGMHGGTIRSPRRGERFYQLIGTPDLVQATQSKLVRGEGLGLDRLVAPLRDGDPVLATFGADVAMESAAEFMTLSHPLVKAAIASLTSDFELPNRLGTVGLDAITDGDSYLVLLGLVEVNGLRPVCKICTPTLRLADFARFDEIGTQLMAAQARGDLRVPAAAHTTVGEEAVLRLEAAMQVIRDELESTHRSSNEALVDGRILTVQRTYEAKIARAEQTLRQVSRDGRAESILRLHKGRIANLLTDLELVQQKLERQREFAVSWRPIGLVVARAAVS